MDNTFDLSSAKPSPGGAYKCRFFSLTASRHTSSQGRLVAIGQTGPCFRSSGLDGEKLIVQQSRNNGCVALFFERQGWITYRRN